MKTRFVIQLKRKYYWEDVLTYWDKKSCLVALSKLLQEGRTARIVEVYTL